MQELKGYACALGGAFFLSPSAWNNIRYTYRDLPQAQYTII